MSLALTSFLLLAAADAGPAAFDYVTAEQAGERMRRCGFAEVSAPYDETIQDNVLVVASAQDATDKQIDCAARVSIETGYWAEMPENVREEYFRIYYQVSKEIDRRLARASLDKQGLLGTVPSYKPGTTDDTAFAGKLEQLCGEEARGALQSQYGPHVIAPDWLATPNLSSKAFKTVTCLSTFASAAGYDLSFIGNEKLPGGGAADPAEKPR